MICSRGQALRACTLLIWVSMLQSITKTPSTWLRQRPDSHQQGDVENQHMRTGIQCRLRLLTDGLLDQRVNDGLQVLFRTGVGKSQGAHLVAVQCAVGIDHRIAEVGAQRFYGQTSGGSDSAGYRIGIEHGSTHGRQNPGGGALAAANATCQTNAPNLVHGRSLNQRFKALAPIEKSAGTWQ